MARVLERAQYWNVTAADRDITFGCDERVAPGALRALRGLDVDVPAAVLFRWVCQLTVAPYSYDWIDHLGRRSPRTLTPGAERVELGQRLMIGPIVAIDPGRELTVQASGRSQTLFGSVVLSYRVERLGPDRSRLLCCLRLAERSTLARRFRQLLVFGDWVMMRKQFLTLKACAEASVRG